MPLTMALLSYAFLDCLPAGFREQMRTVCMPSSCPHCASLRAPRCQRRSWLRANFSQPMKVEELAELVHMSVSSIKSVTSMRSEEHTSELQSRLHIVCRLLLEKKTNISTIGLIVPR